MSNSFTKEPQIAQIHTDSARSEITTKRMKSGVSSVLSGLVGETHFHPSRRAIACGRFVYRFVVLLPLLVSLCVVSESWATFQGTT